MTKLIYPGVILPAVEYQWGIVNAPANAQYAFQIFQNETPVVGVGNNGTGNVGSDGSISVIAPARALGSYEVQFYFSGTGQEFIFPMQSIASLEFIWRPDAGVSSPRKPNVNTIRFGEGYEQTQPIGLNSNPLEWSLSFSGLSDIELMQIDLFLSAMRGATPFYWRDVEGKRLRYTCPEWAPVFNGDGANSLSAQFKQKFL